MFHDKPYTVAPWDKLMLPGKTAENYNASMQKRLQEQLKTKKWATSTIADYKSARNPVKSSP